MVKKNMESYVDALWPALADQPRREVLVERVIAAMRTVVNEYAVYCDDDVGHPMHVPSVAWGGHATRRAWMDLWGQDGEQIEEAAVERREPGTAVADLVGRAEFVIGDSWRSMEAFTITTTPPDVLGHNGEPLGAAQLEGALNDMQLLTAHLKANGD